MAANRQQGSYLAVFLAGFVAFPAGIISLSSSAIVGGLLAVGGLALMIYSLAGFHRIKPLEFSKD